MKLAHLRYFKHLASVMSYTKAAKDLFIAQPTLSAAIIRMEQELGFSLLSRFAHRANHSRENLSGIRYSYT